MQLFVSYARADRPRADPLAQQLRRAGNTVWLDSELSGGQVWWDRILEQLRQCDAIIVIVSRPSLKSPACTSERHYAMSLGKPALPVAIERIGQEMLPSEIARLQIIDYTQPSEGAAFQLVGAITRLPPPPRLPDPLPAMPAVPLSYLAVIADQLSAPTLSEDQQFAIVGKLERAFAPSADPYERAAAYEYLTQMQERSDLLAAVDRRIAILKDSAPRPPGSASAPPTADRHEPGSRPPGPRPGAPRQEPGAPRQEPGAPRQEPGAPRQEQAQGPVPAAAGAISPHWVMAVVALFIFFPLGIAAVINAARVRPRLRMGDLAAARKSSSNVKIFFWICVALIGIGIFANVFQSLGSTGTTGLARTILP